MKNIIRIYNVLESSLFTIHGKLDYDRVMDGIILLCDHINQEENTEQIWEYQKHRAAIMDFLPGAYWHFTEWHGGQDSKGYAVLCAIGSIFSPQWSDLAYDNDGEISTYCQLERLAENYH